MAQGYSRQNDGYGESPGVNWGKVGLYGAGAAASYGLIRAGAIKARGSKTWNNIVQMSGMKNPGGWKAYQQHGAEAINSGRKSLINRQIKGLIPSARGWNERHAANLTPDGSLARANKRQRQANRTSQLGEAQKARRAKRAKGYLRGTNPSYVDPDPARQGLTAMGDLSEELSWMNTAKKNHVAPSSMPIERGYASSNPFSSEIKNLLNEKKSLSNSFAGKGFRGGAMRDGAGLLGFFGAGDLKGAGLKRAGAIGMRGAGAFAAVGLGMKALSYLNPFGD